MTEPPFVTFAILAYNQEEYIRAAAEAALAQDYLNLEIIFSDDFSKDATFNIMQEIASSYNGAHHVIARRNPHNLGLSQHFNKVMAQAQGEIVVVAGGDDISLPNRVSQTVELFVADPEATFVSLGFEEIDQTGDFIQKGNTKTTGLPQRSTLESTLVAGGPGFHGASSAYKRMLFDIFGDLDKSCPFEDAPYVLRGLILGAGWSSPKKGVFYRKHRENLSSGLYKLNLDALRNQYEADLEVARKNGFLDERLCLVVEKWIEKWHYYHTLMRNFNETKSKSIFFLTKILPSKYISKIHCWNLCKLAIKNKCKMFFDKFLSRERLVK